MAKEMAIGTYSTGKEGKQMNKKMKLMVSLVAALVLSLGSAITGRAAQWVYDGPEIWLWWWQEDDGSWPSNCWKYINGEWYHFDGSGYLDIGWHNYPTTEEYYDGGYTYTTDAWYFMYDSGAMASNLTFEGGYIDGEGLLHYGEFTDYDDVEDLFYNRNSMYPWKNQLVDAIISADDNKSVSQTPVSILDFQLPENWRNECPWPIKSE
jgi:hypothetical protein